MKFRIEQGSYGLYYILYKKKWWHRWRYVMKDQDDGRIKYWDSIASAQTEIEKLKTI